MAERKQVSKKDQAKKPKGEESKPGKEVRSDVRRTWWPQGQ